MSTTLEKRLDALERIAEELRMRPFRELAAERNVPFESLMGHYRECQARTARLRAQGYTNAQITEAAAQRLGLSVQELESRASRLLAKTA